MIEGLETKADLRARLARDAADLADAIFRDLFHPLNASTRDNAAWWIAIILERLLSAGWSDNTATGWSPNERSFGLLAYYAGHPHARKDDESCPEAVLADPDDTIDPLAEVIRE